MDPLEILTIGKEFFTEGQLLLFVLVWGCVRYIFRPLSVLIGNASRQLAEPEKEGEKTIKSELVSFMDAMIDALHERVFTSRRMEKHLETMAGTLESLIDALHERVFTSHRVEKHLETMAGTLESFRDDTS